MQYKRILLKLSGEALMGDRSYGIDPKRLAEYAKEIKQIHDLGIEIAIVIGGGNIFRGVAGASNGMDRVQGDYMGMLATVINGMALQSALENAGLYTRLQSAIKMEAIAEKSFCERKHPLMGAIQRSDPSEQGQYIRGWLGPGARATLRFLDVRRTRIGLLCLPNKLPPCEPQAPRCRLSHALGLLPVPTSL